MKFWAHLHQLKNVVVFIYCTECILRGLINLALQCTYLGLQKTYSNESNFQEKQLIEIRIRHILDLMLDFGQIHREVGTIGVFYYAAIVAGTTVFYMIRVLSCGKFFDYSKGNSFLKFLSNPRDEEDRVSKRIDSYIERIVQSNMNFTEAIIRRNSSFGGFVMKQLHPNDLFHFVTKPIEPRRKEISKTSFGRASFLTKFKNQTFFNNWSSEALVVDELTKQREYLNYLAENQNLIWPSNRTLSAETSLKSFWFLIYLCVNIFYWSLGQLCSVFALILSSTSVNRCKWGEKYQKFTPKDKISLADYQMFVFVSIDFFFIPITILITGIKDQIEHLQSLKPKVEKIYEHTKRLEYWNNNLIDHSIDQIKLIEKESRNLRFKCDKESIELYLRFQLFRDDVKGLINIAQTCANQYFIFIFLTLSPVVAYYQDISGMQIGMPTFVLFTLMISINIAFWLCAALHSACSKISKRAWSFIAFAEGYNQNIDMKEQLTISNQMSSSSHANSLNGICYGQDLREFDFEYYSRCPISPHTVMLWRRLVADYNLLTDNFVSKLFGIFRIDYTGILRFNYWLMSIALFTLSNIKH